MVRRKAEAEALIGIVVPTREAPDADHAERRARVDTMAGILRTAGLVGPVADWLEAEARHWDKRADERRGLRMAESDRDRAQAARVLARELRDANANAALSAIGAVADEYRKGRV